MNCRRMRILNRLSSILSLAFYILPFYPVQGIHVCQCQVHSSSCPCCQASVSKSGSSPISHILRLHKDRGAEHNPMGTHHHSSAQACSLNKASEEGMKLSGFCRCKETKENYKHSSVAVLIHAGKGITLGEGSKVFCWKIGRPLPSHKIPPMKPPPIV